MHYTKIDSYDDLMEWCKTHVLSYIDEAAIAEFAAEKYAVDNISPKLMEQIVDFAKWQYLKYACNEDEGVAIESAIEECIGKTGRGI